MDNKDLINRQINNREDAHKIEVINNALDGGEAPSVSIKDEISVLLFKDGDAFQRMKDQDLHYKTLEERDNRKD